MLLFFVCIFILVDLIPAVAMYNNEEKKCLRFYSIFIIREKDVTIFVVCICILVESHSSGITHDFHKLL